MLPVFIVMSAYSESYLMFIHCYFISYILLNEVTYSLSADCSADTEVAAGVQTARGYHALVQRDPHDDVTSEQSTDTTDGTSEESESDCHSVHSDSASELGKDICKLGVLVSIPCLC